MGWNVCWSFGNGVLFGGGVLVIFVCFLGLDWIYRRVILGQRDSVLGQLLRGGDRRR